MGIDDMMMDAWERGWHGSDKLICPHCVGDDYLKTVVTNSLDDDESCSFCGKSPASAFDVFMAAFMVGVRNSFEQADNAGMPWDGGYVFTTYEHFELPDEFDWIAAGDYEVEVVDEIRGCLEEKTYASRWWLELEPDKALSSAWQEFCEQIQHRTRFVFWAGQDDAKQYEGAGEVSVAKVLETIGSLLVVFDLIKTLPAATITYRARGHARESDSAGWAAADLGTNLPTNSTSSSRMSPAGIPLFYGADNTETALAEVSRVDPSEYFTVGAFITTRPLAVIDLTSVPAVPSIFDPELGSWRGQLIFLNDLVEELRRPVETTRSNLDYVPTQVFCEYFLRVYDRTDIRGLAWKSAARPTGDRCLALDIAHEDCVDAADGPSNRPQLELVANDVNIHQRRTNEFRPL